MNFLPLVERELRVIARTKRAYWNRSYAGAAVLVVLWLSGVQSWEDLTARSGHRLFEMFSFLAWLMCVLAGAVATSNSITKEKQEGTLGFLFLSGLSARDVVLGKLLAQSIPVVTALVAAIPVLLLPLVIGGVSWGDAARLVIVIANTLWFSLAIGVWASIVGRNEGVIGLVLLAALLLSVFAPVLAGVWLNETYGLDVAGWLVAGTSPAFSLWSASETNRGMGGFSTGAFGWSILAVHSLAWMFIFSASFGLRRYWQQELRGPRRGPLDRFLGILRYGTPALRERRRHRLLAINPFYWLTSRTPGCRSRGWV